MAEDSTAHLLPSLVDAACQTLRSRFDGYCVFSTLDGMTREPSRCSYSISVSLAFMDMAGAEADAIFGYVPDDVRNGIKERLKAWRDIFYNEFSKFLDGEPEMPMDGEPFKRVASIAQEDPALARDCFRKANDMRFNMDTEDYRVTLVVAADADAMTMSLSISLFGEGSKEVLSMPIPSLGSKSDVDDAVTAFARQLTLMGLPDRVRGGDLSEAWRARQETEAARFAKTPME